MAKSDLQVTIRTRKQGTGAKEAQSELDKLNKSAFGLKNVFATLAGGTAIGAVVGGLKFVVGEAMAAERAMALTESAIKATGGAAGLTAGQVADMAGELSIATGVADDVIQSGQNMLLTFKEIKGEANFERATKAMTDMAVAMNQGSLEGLDLKSTAIQLGKALNDPIKGVTALTKVGVTFAQAQKDAIKAMVEAGDVAGAQAIILAELESEFGGAAEAAGETLAGSLAKLKNAVGELSEDLGSKLIPPLTTVAETALLLVTWTDKLSAAFEEQRDRLEGSNIVYDEYTRSLVDAAVRSGKLNRMQGDLILAWKAGELTQQIAIDSAEIHAQKIGLLTEALFDSRFETDEATRATARLAVTTETMTAATGAYDTMIAAAMATTDSYNAALDATKVTADLVTGSMQAYNAQLLFNEVAAGLSSEAQLVLAAHLGLVDTATLSMLTTLPQLTAQFDLNGDGAVGAGEDVQGYIQALLALDAELSALDGKTANTYVNQHYVTTGYELPDTQPGEVPGQPTPYQHGIRDLIVPPGFWHDNFLMGVTSGERVTVTPAGSQHEPAGGGANVTIANMTINAGGGARARDLAQDFAAELRRALSSGAYALGR